MDEILSILKSLPFACLAMAGVLGIAWAWHEIRGRRGK